MIELAVIRARFRCMFFWNLAACFIILAVAVLLLIPSADLYFRPVYPAKAESRAQAFRSVFAFAQAYASAIKKKHEMCEVGRLWSWRAVLMSENYGMSEEQQAIDWTEPWISKLGAPFDAIAVGTMSRPNGSPFIMAVAGEGTALSIGIGNLREMPKNLILFVEVGNNSLSWMEPIDLRLDYVRLGKGLRPGSEDGPGFHVVFADGATWYLSNNTPKESISVLLSKDTAVNVNREELLRDYIIVKHRGS
jgi:hypothetical protein